MASVPEHLSRATPVGSSAAPGDRPPEVSVADVLSRLGGFESAYEELCGEVADYIYRRTGDAHVTEDLVSDVFLSALKGMARVRDPELPFRFWLFRIASNRVNRWWKSSRRRERLASALGMRAREAVVESPAGDPRADALASEMRRLSAAFQTVLSLHYLQGLSIDEIAVVLECAPGTVKSRLARARARFLECLDAGKEDRR